MAAATLGEASDSQLVQEALAGRQEAAFGAIVRRHGQMVFHVCWRVLQQDQDTEDAFQATFLLLAQKLPTIRKHGSLASWLHGVARRVALKARAQAASRRRHERQASLPAAWPAGDPAWPELQVILDAELTHLPEKWRLPLILCYLEGRTQDEAAVQVGCSRTTLRRRLTEARVALGRRLARRGLGGTAVPEALLLSDCVAPAALPPGLAASTVEAATAIAGGQCVASAAISAKVAALTRGVLTAVLPTNLKIAAVVLLAAGLLATTAVKSARLWMPPLSAAPEEQVFKKGPLPQKSQPDNLKKRIRVKVEEVYRPFLKGDVATFVDHAHPDWVTREGGRERMIRSLKKVAADMRAQGFTFQSLQVEQPREIVADGVKHFAVVPYVAVMKAPGGKVREKGFVVGISGDQGKTWTLVSGDPARIRTLLPNLLPANLELPEIAPPVFEKGP
jgi:RNA polymerase sigma factor (sigma-70 family)